MTIAIAMGVTSAARSGSDVAAEDLLAGIEPPSTTDLSTTSSRRMHFVPPEAQQATLWLCRAPGPRLGEDQQVGRW